VPAFAEVSGCRGAMTDALVREAVSRGADVLTRVAKTAQAAVLETGLCRRVGHRRWRGVTGFSWGVE